MELIRKRLKKTYSAKKPIILLDELIQEEEFREMFLKKLKNSIHH